MLAPDNVSYDAAHIQRWRPGTLERPAPRRHGRLVRLWIRADVFHRSEVWLARLRRRWS